MATLKVWKAFDLESNGERYSGGSRSGAVEITVDGKVKEWTGTLATSTTVTLLDLTGSNEPLTNFDFAWIESDQNLILELTADAGNQVGDETNSLEIQAGRPFDLLSDDAYAGYTSLTSLTEDVIDLIKVRNVSGQTATIRAVFIT